MSDSLPEPNFTLLEFSVFRWCHHVNGRTETCPTEGTCLTCHIPCPFLPGALYLMLSSCVHSRRSSGSGEHCVLLIKLTVPSSSSLSQVLPRCPCKVLLPLKAWMAFRSFKSIEMTGPQTACLQLTHGKRKGLFFSAFGLNLHICHFCTPTMVRSSQEARSSPSYPEPTGSSQFGGFCGDDGLRWEADPDSQWGWGNIVGENCPMRTRCIPGLSMVRARSCREQNAKELSRGDQWPWMPPWSSRAPKGTVLGRWYLYHG